MRRLRSALWAGMSVLLGACASSIPQRPVAPDLSGDWMLTTESALGTQVSDMRVRQDGERLSGTISSPMGSMNHAGTLTGKNVAFAFTFVSQGMEVRIHYQGSVDGDTMRGTAKIGDFGEGKFVATRRPR